MTKETRDKLYAEYTMQVLDSPVASMEMQQQRIRDAVIYFLMSVASNLRLLPVIVSTIGTSCDGFAQLVPQSAVQAFSALEVYAKNLYDAPWKKEFHTISTYSGFFKTKIDSDVINIEFLFALLGYDHVGDVYKLTKLPTHEELGRAAFEFHLASVECQVLDEICASVKPLDVQTVWSCRLQVTGSVDDCIRAIRSKYPSTLLCNEPFVCSAMELDETCLENNENDRNLGDDSQNKLQTDNDLQLEHQPIKNSNTDSLNARKHCGNKDDMSYGFPAISLFTAATIDEHQRSSQEMIEQLGKDSLCGKTVAKVVDESEKKNSSFSTFKQKRDGSAKLVSYGVKSSTNQVDSSGGVGVLQRSKYQDSKQLSQLTETDVGSNSVVLRGRGRDCEMPAGVLSSRGCNYDKLSAILQDVNPGIMSDSIKRQKIISQLKTAELSISDPADYNVKSLPGSFVAEPLWNAFPERRGHTEPLTRRPLHAEKDRSETRIWQCASCTYANAQSVVCCEMCTRPRTAI